MQVKRSLLVELPAERIFDIVERAEEYPEFLPWCASATILERGDGIVDARIGVDYHGLRFSFRTRNPKERPHWLEVRMVDGPFRRFDGVWRFTPLSPSACKIEFGLHCEVSDFFVGRLASPVFNRVTDSLVNAFIRRAEKEHTRALAPVAAAAEAPAAPAAPAAHGEDGRPGGVPASEPGGAGADRASIAADGSPAEGSSAEGRISEGHIAEGRTAEGRTSDVARSDVAPGPPASSEPGTPGAPSGNPPSN